MVYLDIFELFLKAYDGRLGEENMSEKNKGCSQVMGSAMLLLRRDSWEEIQVVMHNGPAKFEMSIRHATKEV